MSRSDPNITITVPDGTQVAVPVFFLPAAPDELVSLEEFFADQLSEPVPEPVPAPPSFDYDNASIDEIWDRIAQRTFDQTAEAIQRHGGKVKSKL